MTPRITTIIPTYRRPQLLARAVHSVLAQTRGEFVVVILDNASGDDTGDVAGQLMRLDARIRYEVRSQNVGGFNNIVDGIRQVQTPFFNVLSDDDMLMPSFFDVALRCFEGGNGEGLAFVSTCIATARDADVFTAQRRSVHGRLDPPNGVVPCLSAGASLPGVLYRTAAMVEVGPPRTLWWNWTESGWHALAAARYPVEFRDEIGAIVQLHAGNTSNLMSAAEFRTSWFRMLAELREAVVVTAAPQRQAFWNSQVAPMATKRFLASAIRLCGDPAEQYDELAFQAMHAGLAPAFVRTVLLIGRVMAAVGMGTVIRRALATATDGAPSGSRAADAPMLQSPQAVLSDLNRRMGIDLSMLH